MAVGLERIYIECTPTDEPCVMVTDAKPYMEDMRKEALRYREMLTKRFPTAVEEGVIFAIKTNRHDFGSYINIDICYDESNERQFQWALFIESHLPEKWDETHVWTALPPSDDDEEDE